MVLIKIYQVSAEKINVPPEIIEITHFPCKIGRSVKNHITLLNDSVSLEHAVLEYKEEQLILRDLNSTNGLIQNAMKKDIVTIEDQELIFLGLQKIEVIKIQDDIKDETKVINIDDILKKAAEDNVINYQKEIKLLFLIPLFFIATFLNNYFFGSNNELSQIAALWITNILSVSFFCFILAVFSKIVSKEFRYLKLLIPLSFFYFTAFPVQLFHHFFNFTFETDIDFELFISIAVSVFTLYWILKIIFDSIAKKTLVLTSIALIFVGYGSILMTTLTNDDEFNDLKYTGSLFYLKNDYQNKSKANFELLKKIETSQYIVEKFRREQKLEETEAR